MSGSDIPLESSGNCLLSAKGKGMYLSQQLVWIVRRLFWTISQGGFRCPFGLFLDSVASILGYFGLSYLFLFCFSVLLISCAGDRCTQRNLRSRARSIYIYLYIHI